MTYLGTQLSPVEYYKVNALGYTNPHAGGIQFVLDRHKQYLCGETILDMGCGDGLITKLMPFRSIIGIDAEDSMIDRYEAETRHKGYVRHFWDELPQADSAVFSYSLHLCPASRRNMVGYRLHQAGVKKVVVISPFKARYEDWCNFRLVAATADCVGTEEKTIYGRAYAAL